MGDMFLTFMEIISNATNEIFNWENLGMCDTI
jgi:hypothetical protein